MKKVVVEVQEQWKGLSRDDQMLFISRAQHLIRPYLTTTSGHLVARATYPLKELTTQKIKYRINSVANNNDPETGKIHCRQGKEYNMQYNRNKVVATHYPIRSHMATVVAFPGRSTS
jgi:hypothetical protein